MADAGHSQEFSKEKFPPMTELEKALLRELVDKYKDVIESKQTGTGMQIKKNEAWKKLENEFCSAENVTKRPAAKLKECWKNMKQRAKTSFTNHVRSLKKTGGGPPEASLSAEAISVAAIIPSQMKSLDNDFDCDGPRNTASPEKVLPVDVDDGFDEDRGPKKRLKTISPRRKHKDARSSLVDMEYEEHKIRLQVLTSELETARILQDKARFEKYMIEVEHQKRMELLNMQCAFYYNQQPQFPTSSSNGFENTDGSLYKTL